MKNKDLATTILGGVLAAATAAEPVINSVDGDFGTPDIIKLVMAVVFAIFGWATNKPTQPAPQTEADALAAQCKQP